MAPVRLPQARSERGLAPTQDRPFDRSERRGDLPRPLRVVGPRDPGEGGARGSVPHPPLHAVDGAAHALRGLRARGHGPMPSSVRRAHRPRALRRDGRGSPGGHPSAGRAPARPGGAHARPGGRRAVRGSGDDPRSRAGARRRPRAHAHGSMAHRRTARDRGRRRSSPGARGRVARPRRRRPRGRRPDRRARAPRAGRRALGGSLLGATQPGAGAGCRDGAVGAGRRRRGARQAPRPDPRGRGARPRPRAPRARDRSPVPIPARR